MLFTNLLVDFIPADLMKALSTLPEVKIQGIKLDSRKVNSGDLFIALPGQRYNGAHFIEAAIDLGATAVVWQTENPSLETRRGVPCIGIPKLNQVVSGLAGRFYQHPSNQLALTGVTGTNGKTTVSHLLAQLWHALAPPAAVMGTVGSGVVQQLLPEALTTPDAVTVQQRLASFVAQGVRAAVMEVSSHALAQGRVEGLNFTTVIATNVSRDHLDYHGSMAAYAAEKARLFTDFTAQYRVFNLDDKVVTTWYDEAKKNDSGTSFGFSLNSVYAGRSSVLVATHCEYSALSARFTLHWGPEKIRVESPLMGRFNIQNLLAALTAILAAGYHLSELIPLVGTLKAVPGRMETFKQPQTPLVVVDYAHTPEALKELLKAVRQHATGKVWCLFGCGGDRDRGKRPQMGQIAAEFADKLIVTDDNPRTEPPAQIIADIRAGIPHGADWIEIAGRKEAIDYGLKQAAPHDVLVCAGKGHETYQEIGTQRFDYDERAYIQVALAQIALAHPDKPEVEYD